MQNENLSTWTTLWKSSTDSNNNFNSEEKQLAEKWNKRSETFGKSNDPDAKAKRTDKIIGFLKDGGFDPRGARVLDIGCGTGALSLPLARLGAEVTAFDVSSGMLKKLSEMSKKENLSILTVEGSWWSADINALGFKNQYDLVLAARTPAIRDADCLNKMIDCSRDYCFYIGFIGKEENSPRRDISRFILKKDNARNSTSMFFPFMYLYLAGYRPEIHVNFSSKKEELPWDKAADRNIEFFSAETNFNEDIKEQIRDYFHKASVNGIYTSQNNMSEGMMLWRKNGKPE